MDNEQNSNMSTPPQPSFTPPPYLPPAPPKKTSGWRVFWGIFTGLSVFANISMFLIVIAMAALFSIGQKDMFTEEVLQEGSRMNKIAVINIDGIIDNQKSRDACKQLDTAAKDKSIKALIIRVNSPGGMVSSSDEIYDAICKYRKQTNRPAVAFMGGIAASGGYYTSVACDKIIAEPTTITGSIGVITGYFVLKDLLEQKLGIEPVIIKSGLKKDWPSSFQPPTEEQRQYMQEKLIGPAFERFTKIVAEGRKDVLTPEDVNRLADGSIFCAKEALDENLIDQIGYFDDAVQLTSKLANISNPQVIEFRKPFSLSGFLTSESQSRLKLDRTTLHEFTTPQIMYLWNAN